MTKIKKISAIMVAAVILCTCFLMSGCGGNTESSSSEKATSAVSNEETTSASTDTTDYKSSYTAIIDVKDYGTIEVELYEELAPITVKNFVDLAKDGFYDGLTFHRIITGFMIQGGDPKGDGTGGSEKTIKGEFAQNGVENNLSHTRGVMSAIMLTERGVISMARSNEPDSASSQFFIVQADSTYLDGQYAAFGKVTKGMDIVDKICKDTPVTDSNGTVEKKNQPVINSIKIEEK